MATIKYLLQSKSENAPIYLRLSLSKTKTVKRKTGLIINHKQWSVSTGLPKQNNSHNKNLTVDLRDLKESILKKINFASIQGVELTGDWLTHNIDVHFNRKSETNQSEYITDVIQGMKDSAKIKKNGKGGIGLSKSRINSYNALTNLIKAFEKRNKFKIRDVNIKFAQDFLIFLIEENNYSKNYAIKKIADLKTVCYSAELDGIKVNQQFKRIQTPSTTNDYILFLSPEEQVKIEKADLPSESLNNARKWLLLGCNIGQRGGDLLNLAQENFVVRGSLSVIELKQEKTGKNVTIPVLENTEEIIQQGLPYKISLQKLNNYIKQVCKKAKINSPTEGLLFDKTIMRKKKGVYEKWELITSHVCRRSFATNNYGLLPTPLLMQITGHRTERMFLKYIGKTSLDYAQQIADFYTLQALKKNKEPQLTVVKSKASN